MKKSSLGLLILLSLGNDGVFAAISFAGRESALVIRGASKLRVGPASGAVGWKDGSIIKDISSGGEGDYNLRNYTVNNGGNYEASSSTVRGSLIHNNSNSIDYLKTRLLNLYGPYAAISSAAYDLSSDVNLDENNVLNTSTSGVIDGAGHTITFAYGKSNLFVIGDGVSVTFANIVLKNFTDAAVQLGTGSSVTFGNNTVIELSAPTTLTRDWTFEGSATIRGYGNKLSLSYFNLGVLQPGILTLQDVAIDDLKRNNLSCIGNNASMVLRDCQMIMANDLTFTAGALQIEHDVKLTGSNTFSYETTRQSTINAASRLFLDLGVTFSYSPRSADKGLLGFTDATSQLYLNGCTIKTTTTGMQLTKGTLIVDHKNSVYNDGATSISQAFALGNGTSADDITIEMMPGGNIEMLTGRMVYADLL